MRKRRRKRFTISTKTPGGELRAADFLGSRAAAIVRAAEVSIEGRSAWVTAPDGRAVIHFAAGSDLPRRVLEQHGVEVAA